MKKAASASEDHTSGEKTSSDSHTGIITWVEEEEKPGLNLLTKAAIAGVAGAVCMKLIGSKGTINSPLGDYSAPVIGGLATAGGVLAGGLLVDVVAPPHVKEQLNESLGAALEPTAATAATLGAGYWLYGDELSGKSYFKLGAVAVASSIGASYAVDNWIAPLL